MLTIRETLKEFKESEAFEHLFNNLRSKYIKEFENSSMDDITIREQIYIKLVSLRELHREIERFINDLQIEKARK